jgi:hypothetical protein
VGGRPGADIGGGDICGGDIGGGDIGGGDIGVEGGGGSGVRVYVSVDMEGLADE